MTSDAAVELLRSLIRRPSITPVDAGCQGVIADRLEACGFRCDTLQYDDVTNLWARLGDEPPLLCFAGHTDVVPPGPAELWDTDPFEPVEQNGCLYGRGAADMKGGLAAMVSAAESFVGRGGPAKGSIAFLLTSDEEGPAIDGTRRVVETLTERGESIDWCVIGEPSSRRQAGDVIRHGRRGSLNGYLTVYGDQGHVAYPEQVDNPIARFAPALASLHDTTWDDGNDHFPPTSFQMVSIESGHGAINVTPPDLRASFNFRYSNEWTAVTLREKVEALLARHRLDHGLRWELSGEPFLTPPGRLTDAVSEAIRESTGALPELSTSGGTSDGRFIAPTGAEVVELGPVNATIHKPNEHVRLDDVRRLTGIYRRIMELLLSQASD
jgi:succinyl-diaminopimelate desuccinylase